MPEQSPVADRAAILAYLRHITEGWQDLGEAAVIELRCLMPDRTPHVARYEPDEAGFEMLADDALGMNATKLNCYVVVNPVRASAPLRRDGRLSGAMDDDIIGAFFFWADGDDENAALSIKNFAGPKWTMAVTTGRVPTPRPHIYWRIEDGPVRNLPAWTEIQKAIANRLSTDRTVVNPARIMRLPGTINWPTDKKAAKGRVPELATLRTDYDDDRSPVTFEQMRRAFGWAADTPPPPTSGLAIDTGGQRRSAEQFADILRRARTDGEKHSGVRDLAASLAGQGINRAMAEAIIRDACPVWDANVEKLIESAYQKFYSDRPTRLEIPENAAAAEADEGDWQNGLLRNSRGRPTWNVANAMLVMRNDPNLRDCFAFDEFRQVKMLTLPLPFSGERRDTFKGREIRDSDITKVVSYFNRIGYPEATKTVTADVIEAVGEMATFHPVRDYLRGLPKWDGVERVSTWLMDYCAANPGTQDQARYISEIGKRWLISAVARVMQPGCKADGVLILEGRQGAMKSTTLRTIAGPEWFGDSLPSMQSKDASDYLRGKWVIELAELSNINKAEVEVVKAFIAREEERFRPAYGRNEITYPRQCVFAGSTNKTDYLRDETGNRRFWPVKVGDLCDVQSLERDRDQIWAEALALFREGEIWWLTGEVVKVAEAQQAERVSQDAWEGDILQYLVGKAETSCATIAKEVLEIEVGRVDRAVTNRISAVLTGNGWTRSGQFTAGVEKGRARYIRSEGG